MLRGSVNPATPARNSGTRAPNDSGGRRAAVASISSGVSMTAAQQLANLITRTVSGPMWHGPALGEVLAQVTPAQAASRPVTGAHSIWELVLHVAVWAEVALARLGPEPPVEPEEDWPSVPEPTTEHWEGALQRLRTSYEQLARAVEGMEDAALATVLALPGPRHTVNVMLHGVVEHGTYHGGQIMLLRRAITASAATAGAS